LRVDVVTDTKKEEIGMDWTCNNNGATEDSEENIGE
jgi:hypothetical protein